MYCRFSKNYKKYTAFEERNTIAYCIETDLRKYSHAEETEEYLTTQSLIECKHLFRGWMMKNLLNVQEFQVNRIKKVNKIIIKKSVEFHLRA